LAAETCEGYLGWEKLAVLAIEQQEAEEHAAKAIQLT
jgi:hypothetical protein